MSPDIRTGPPALPSAAPLGGKAASQPGDGPLAALFAALLERGGPTAPLAPPPVKPAAVKDQTVPLSGEKKTEGKKTEGKKTEDQAAPTILPPPWKLPPLKLPELDPHGPSIPGGAVGTRKTMDTVAASASPRKGKETPAGELPLRLVRADAPAAFPLFLLVPPPSGVASPGVAVPAATSVRPAAASARPVTVDAAGSAAPQPSAAPQVVSRVTAALPAAVPSVAQAPAVLTAPQAAPTGVVLNAPLPTGPGQVFSLPPTVLPPTVLPPRAVPSVLTPRSWTIPAQVAKSLAQKPAGGPLAPNNGGTGEEGPTPPLLGAGGRLLRFLDSLFIREQACVTSL